MNLELMRERLKDAKESLDEIRAKCIRLSMGKSTEEEINAAEKDLNAAKRCYDLVKRECEEMEKEQQKPQALKPVETPEDKSLKAMLKSNEYARSFLAAIRMGAKADRSTGYHESLKPVYDALTIAGGDPKGSDGGFLVPEDIDNTVREVMMDNDPLNKYFDVENVGAGSGWRVKDTAPTAGFTKLDGELTPIPNDDQPEFAQVPFKMDTYGLFLPLSRELLQDEDANLMAYLGRWFGKKEVITENKLLIALISNVTAFEPKAGMTPVDALKSLLNKGLKQAHSRHAIIITNENGLDLLDQEKDQTGRPLLQPDVTDETKFKVKGRELVVVDSAFLPDLGGGVPLYVGDMKQLGTLYRRNRLEMDSTSVGGEAWRKNGVEVRGITRLGTSVFDVTSAKLLTIKNA